MKTLVIHPDDRSTDFLKIIYEGKGYTVINDREILKSPKQVSKLIKKHHRIIMLGHGHPRGLFYTCINPEMVYLLREKECICIWCNADQFVEKYGLKGFYTGMFISEVGEAHAFGIHKTQEEIDYSNNLFVTNFREVMDKPDVLTEIKKLYDGDCAVIKFNNERLYHSDKVRLLSERRVDMIFEDDDDDLDPAGGHGLYSHI